MAGDDAVAWTSVARSGTLATEALGHRVTRIWEEALLASERAYFYLIEDDAADWLIDGGYGLAPSLDPIRSDPGKPLNAIATHSHCDHIGLLHHAARRYGHAAEASVFADPSPMATQALPWLAGRPMLAGGNSFDPATIRQQPCPLTAFLNEGDHVALSSRRLTVLHLPGHSRGSIALLDSLSRYLFVGDVVHDGDILDDIDGADADRLLVSHERLKRVEFQLACPGHGALLDRDASLARIDEHARLREGHGRNATRTPAGA